MELTSHRIDGEIDIIPGFLIQNQNPSTMIIYAVCNGGLELLEIS